MARVCERYGYLPWQYRKLSSTDLEWLDKYPIGVSAGRAELQKLKNPPK